MVLDENVLARISRTTIDNLKECSKAFVQNEGRLYIYPNALNKVQGNFGKPDEVCEGISDLLRGWHNGFYRFGSFDKAEILKSIKHYYKQLDNLRARNIRNINLDEAFETEIKTMFCSFLDATAGKNRRFTRRTVTGTSKCLGLLAPSLFPMCDEAISQAYDCWWVYSDFGFIEYLKFMQYMRILAKQLVAEYSKKHSIANLTQAEIQLVSEVKAYSGDAYQYDKTLLKVIDEYNYAKYSKPWC
jgi:hypothetical protein